MKILSFDVGIKNLAYCIINKNNEDFEVEDWGIIDLSNSSKKCSYEVINKKNIKKQCDEKACYSFNNGEIVLCKDHKNKINELLFKQDINYKNENKDKCITCDKKAHVKLDNITYCKLHSKDVIKPLKPEKIVQNSNKIPIQVLSVTLCNKLDEHENFLDVDHVVIENQPTLINPTMKTISSFLFSYFTIKGICDNNKNCSLAKFMAPCNKLKIFNDKTTEILGDKNAKKKDIYKKTKALGTKYCKILLGNRQDKIDFLESNSKKDDLADSFLQGIYYLYNSNNQLDIFKQKLNDNVNQINV